MRDDLATITNTYPDHEDHQGPAGYNIPEVMTKFIPRKSRLLTSEDQMLPILAEAARKVDTSVRPVTWLDAGLLTPDILERFPYEEHPNNIALVLAMADELGVGRDFALKEMADRVVADLGVLKTYPVARVRGRRLQFVNGMSANERHGCLGNWTRLRFDRQDPVAEPGVWITTVVNNRADRVPRSKVFAKILVEDIVADRHFLIGTNLSGLQGFIREAWKSHAPSLHLWSEKSDRPAAQILAETVRRFRIPTERQHVLDHLRAMVAEEDLPEDIRRRLDALLEDPEALGTRLKKAGMEERVEPLLRHLEDDLRRLAEYRELARRVERAGADERRGLESEFRELLGKWFQERIVVVEDPYTSGEQLVERISAETPPGFLNRIMGLQNIKGTGLDFVYRWQAWDTCHQACVQLKSKNVTEASDGLKTLVSFQEYGLLSEAFVRETIQSVKSAPTAQRESFQAELAVVQSNFDLAMHHVNEKLNASTGKAGKITAVIGAIEGFLDAGDAIKRRRTANRIYRDLARGRISYDRAARELQNLTKRQKGGWLFQKLRFAQNLLGRHLAIVYGRAGK
jgi:hypothetical protein